MAGAIWDAIGRALQTGGQTYGRLSQIEQEQKAAEIERQDRLRQQEIQNQMASQRFKLDQDQFAQHQKDREYRILMDAIEGLAPNAIASPELFGKAKEFGQEGRFSQSMDMKGMLPTGMLGIALPQLEQVTRRAPTFKESQDIEESTIRREERRRINAFREHVQSPEHAGEDFDTQTREAFAHGINNMPMSSKEWDRRQSVEFDQQKKLAGIRASGSGGRSGPSNPGAKWLQGFNTIVDNVRAQYGAELSAFARAAADGRAGAEERLAQLQQKIQQEAMDMASKLLGPMPGIPQDVIPPPAGGGVNPVDQFLAENPNVTIEEVRAEASIPLEAKKAIIARLMSTGAKAQPQVPQAPTQSPRGAGGNPNMGVDVLEWLKSKLTTPQPTGMQGMNPNRVPRKGQDW